MPPANCNNSNLISSLHVMLRAGKLRDVACKFQTEFRLRLSSVTKLLKWIPVDVSSTAIWDLSCDWQPKISSTSTPDCSSAQNHIACRSHKMSISPKLKPRRRTSHRNFTLQKLHSKDDFSLNVSHSNSQGPEEHTNTQNMLFQQKQLHVAVSLCAG